MYCAALLHVSLIHTLDSSAVDFLLETKCLYMYAISVSLRHSVHCMRASLIIHFHFPSLAFVSSVLLSSIDNFLLQVGWAVATGKCMNGHNFVAQTTEAAN